MIWRYRPLRRQSPEPKSLPEPAHILSIPRWLDGKAQVEALWVSNN